MPQQVLIIDESAVTTLEVSTGTRKIGQGYQAQEMRRGNYQRLDEIYPFRTIEINQLCPGRASPAI
jgi:hypothetical protein